MLEMRKWFGLAAAAVVSGAAVSAHAAFVSPSSWSRGADGTTYQQWDVFTDDAGEDHIIDNVPDVGNINSNGTASVSENGGHGAFLTGGNIYSFSAPTDFTVTIPENDVPDPQHNVTAIVQFRTLGTDLDYDSVLLNGLSAVDTTQLASGDSGNPRGGGQVDSWFLFNVPYADFGDGAAGVEDLTLTFNASGSSLSLDRLSIDTAIRPGGFYDEPTPVPEPASLALLGAGGMLTMLRRRRRAA